MITRSVCMGLMVLLGFTPLHAVAQETTSYVYDARGRVVSVNKTGGPSNGVATTYQYDPADNRTRVTVTGATNTGNGSGDGSSVGSVIYIVVPLNGYTVMRVVK